MEKIVELASRVRHAKFKEGENGRLKPSELYISVEDYEWLVNQAKILHWARQAISVCNEEGMTPEELAKILKN